MLNIITRFLVILLVPLFIISASFWIIAQPWFINYEYNQITFPPDEFGMSKNERTQLALKGLSSVVLQGEGVTVLKKAHLSDGSPAFNNREIRHMADVRTVVWWLFFVLAYLAALMLTVVSSVWHKLPPQFMAKSLQIGAIATLSLLGLALMGMFFDFDWLFLKFHHLFFEGQTFMFDERDTLLRLYPEKFWFDGTLYVGALSFVSALVLLLNFTIF